MARKTTDRRVQRIIKAGEAIRQEPPDRADFLHSVLCQVGMPRKKVDEPYFERSCGLVNLSLQAGRTHDGKEWKTHPLPYGTRPRLILVHISSEAIRNQSREVEVGRSTHDFMKRIGLDTNGRHYAMFKQQMLALSLCRLTISTFREGRVIMHHTQPVETFDAWLSQPIDRQQLSLWPGTLKLTEGFYSSLREFAVPLDYRALGSLSHSSLALDTYTWLSHRLCRINDHRGVKLTWWNLREQFGQEYSDIKSFSREIKAALRQVCAVYPSARIEQVHGGIHLYPSPPPVSKTRIGYEAKLSSGIRPPFRE